MKKSKVKKLKIKAEELISMSKSLEKEIEILKTDKVKLSLQNKELKDQLKSLQKQLKNQPIEVIDETKLPKEGSQVKETVITQKADVPKTPDTKEEKVELKPVPGEFKLSEEVKKFFEKRSRAHTSIDVKEAITKENKNVSVDTKTLSALICNLVNSGFLQKEDTKVGRLVLYKKATKPNEVPA